MSVLSATGRNSQSKSKRDIGSIPRTLTSDVSVLPNVFHFWNGDEYSGEFVINKDQQKMVMEGKGVYKTVDGEIYEGIWSEDYLKDKCKITFSDKSTFRGNLEEMVIQGQGKYTFKENVQIEGEFVNNDLVGKVYLKDPHNHIWKGKVKSRDTFVSFYPVHAFWQSILQLPIKANLFLNGEAEEENENIWD